MAKLRKACAYRKLERPYTRKSKFKAKSFVRASPQCKIVKFNMGNLKKTYPFVFHLVSKNDIQLRHNALESARLACLRVLEKALGKSGYSFQVRVYPHHILRENPLASGAGADRMSTGMKCSFGKAIGVAARVKVGKEIFTVTVPKEHREIARRALKSAGYKFACQSSVVEENNHQK
ncbi:50S ribosomal protein L16 [Candidatus Woesearchaeota archaeon CG10_big_fil_rev_8_21_14_0_10_34_8]|nr:MAG: 50S ribosomal protein L16 [Candidatus Woesearchaeota archaeon CG10_big_fil_rev_8_21_14_0_10_34_8]